MHDKTTPIPGKTQSYRDLPEDDKVKMIAPPQIPPDTTVNEILEHLENGEIEPLPEMETWPALGVTGLELIERRLRELETTTILNYKARRKIEEKISFLETALDNQMVASTDAINGLVEQVADLEKLSKWQHAVIVALLVDTCRNQDLFRAMCLEAVEGVAMGTADNSIRETLRQINRRQKA
jgi:hypothetical protein